MSSRPPTHPGVVLTLRERVANCETLLAERKESADKQGVRLGELEQWRATVEKDRAADEVRDEYRDEKARSLAKFGIAGSSGSLVWQLADWISALIQQLGGGQ